MVTFRERIRKAVNVFTEAADQAAPNPFARSGDISYGGGRPDRPRLRLNNDRNIIASIYTRISLDVAAVPIRHVTVDQNRRYVKTVDKSGINECLTVEANIDQAGRAFRQDIALSLFDKGVIAIVPTMTSADPATTDSYDIYELRVGEVIAFYPRHVRVKLWNDVDGRHEEVVVSKKVAAIVENPLYQVMNETNSTLQRLIRKLNLLDTVDEQMSSGKLDIIIQLPYLLKTEAKKNAAEERRTEIERQLKGSQYGIAYTESSEKITQLNRPAENNMLKQIEVLTEQLYAQLGLTESVFNGTADEATMLNYQNRTVEPIAAAVAEAMHRTWLSKTARTQGQAIIYQMDAFRLITVSSLAELGDKFIRNEIMTSNEIRGLIGLEPVDSKQANELHNPNVPQPSAPAVEVAERPALTASTTATSSTEE